MNSLGKCSVITQTTFSQLGNCIKINNSSCILFSFILFSEIEGGVPLFVENSSSGKVNSLCFSKCKSRLGRHETGTALHIESKELEINSTSFFGCVASYNLNEERYICYIKSVDSLVHTLSNSSFCRTSRGSGPIISVTKVSLYSKCIYACDFCGSITLYTQLLVGPALASGLIFINNVHDGFDGEKGILIYHYLEDVPLTVADSYFINNDVSKYFTTDNLINIKNTYFSESNKKIQGENINLLEENQFSDDLKKILPLNIDKDVICFRRLKYSSRLLKHKFYISFSLILSMCAAIATN